MKLEWRKTVKSEEWRCGSYAGELLMLGECQILWKGNAENI